MSSVGKRIAQARAKAKLTGAELAAKAGVTASWVRSVETGRTGKPAPEKLARIAAVVGLDVRELLALTDQLGAAATTAGSRSSRTAPGCPSRSSTAGSRAKPSPRWTPAVGSRRRSGCRAGGSWPVGMGTHRRTEVLELIVVLAILGGGLIGWGIRDAKEG